MTARELIVLLVLCVVWGFHFIVIKASVAEIPPIFYAALRMSLVAIAMAPFLRWRRGRMVKVFAAGVCFGALNYTLFFSGIKLATASTSAIANELYVPFATIMSVIFLKERIGWPRIAGISLAFVGVAVIALSRDDAPTGERIGLGIGLVAAAAFVESFGAILVKQIQGVKPWELLAWFGVIGAIGLWPLSAIFERGQFAALAASNKTMVGGAILYSAVGASIFGHTAYYWLLQRRPVSMIAPSTLLTTMLAVAFAVVLFGDPFTVPFVVGGLMTLGGVGIVIFRGAAAVPEPGAPESIIKSADGASPAAAKVEISR